MNRCGDCKWLDPESTKLGYECKCPSRPFVAWENKYAKWKDKCVKACQKYFEPKTK